MWHTVTAAASHDPDGDGSGPVLRPVHNQSGHRPALTRTPGSGRRPPNILVSVATGLLFLLAAGLFAVSLDARYLYVFHAKHQSAASWVQALAPDVAMAIFSLLALGLARAGKAARVERVLIIACAGAEAREAEVFLKLNDVLAVPAFARFQVAVQAGRPGQADVDRIVRAPGLRIAPGRAGGGICAVATLRRVYGRGGAAVLSKALRIIRDAYGEAGLDGPVIDGIGLLCQRYDGQLAEQRAVDRLAAAHGGVSGLVSRAGQLRQTTGTAMAQRVAAAAVEVINRGPGGSKLQSYWKAQP